MGIVGRLREWADRLRGRQAVPPEPVLAIARQHLNGLRPPHGRRWCEPHGFRVSDGWFFGYQAEWIDPGPPEQMWAGAPGFVVADDGSVRTVGWRDLRERYGLPTS